MNELLERFNKFKSAYTGNAQEEVMNLVRSGKITQEQLNRAQHMATQLMRILQ